MFLVLAKEGVWVQSDTKHNSTALASKKRIFGALFGSRWLHSRIEPNASRSLPRAAGDSKSPQPFTHTHAPRPNVLTRYLPFIIAVLDIFLFSCPYNIIIIIILIFHYRLRHTDLLKLKLTDNREILWCK